MPEEDSINISSELLAPVLGENIYIYLNGTLIAQGAGIISNTSFNAYNFLYWS